MAIESQSFSNQEALDEMNKAIQEVASSTETQTAEVFKVTDAATETSLQVDAMMAELENVKQETVTSAKQANIGKENASILENKIKMFESQMNDMLKTYDQLHENVDRSVTFIDSIKNITEQTGLLALNASIEAARAGEHGKGFAVVAEEIKKLADHTEQTASQISSNLTTMQVTNQNTNKQLEGLLLELKENIELTHDNENKFVNLENHTNQLQKLLEDFSTSAERVRSFTSTINQAMDQISGNIEQSTASVEEISATVHDQSTQNKQLHQEIAATTNAVQQLTKEEVN
ncbi:methyl-accepting chemotaxis protein [Halalkalibacillus halophilus]|uniref:methyl-accepting chemotaxis protein n=1 Tax=Halalkalibacillus halophilus TaxID=392827 RepID=UPI0004202926|nr:methyl-accepting chemotaxis protein [Halalkalibacillus halophilus]